MKIGSFPFSINFGGWSGHLVWLFFATTSVHGADLAQFELRKNASEKPLVAQNELDDIRAKRAELRDQTILKSHTYEHENTAGYLKGLNDQLMSMETLELILHDYRIVYSDLMQYKSVLDACLNHPEARCDEQAQSTSKAVTEYYELVEFIGALKDTSKLDIVSKATDPLVQRLAAIVDAVASKEVQLAKKLGGKR